MFFSSIFCFFNNATVVVFILGKLILEILFSFFRFKQEFVVFELFIPFAILIDKLLVKL